MNDNEDNTFPKRFTVSGDKILQGETVYGQRTVDKLQAERAALRQQVQTLTAALEKVKEWNERKGQEEGDRFYSLELLLIVREALAAVGNEREGG